MEVLESHIVLLLQLIANKAGARSLLRRGLTYVQISRLISYAADEGLIQQDGDGYSLTESGLARMKSDIVSGKLRRDGGWISPEEESRVATQPADEVYLPKMRKSYF